MYNYVVYEIWKKIMFEGRESCPRDQKILEIDYFQGIIDNPWSTYAARKYPLSYAKAEFQWYLTADPYNTEIFKHAKMWEKIQQTDGSIFSNYGYYWFNTDFSHGLSGFDWVVDTLTKDPDSRQAYLPMNSFVHTFIGNKDVVCSKGPQFRIIDGALSIHVAFRSSDAVYGLGTDLITYWWLWEMVAVQLDIPRGQMVFSADSLHIYEKHWDMVRQVIDEGMSAYTPVEYPPITDAEDLINQNFDSDFGKWLRETKL